MNMALAEYEAAHSYSKPTDVETVMQILANAGYNTINWQCLTTGYEVYWDKQENKMVLYNSATGELEYPDEYEGNEFTAQNKTDERFVQYNNNVKTALSYDYSFSSSTAAQNGSTLSSTTSSDSSAQAISSAISGTSGSSVKSALGLSGSGTVYVNASSTNYSPTYNASNPSASTYAQVTAYHLSNQEKIVIENNGELKANTFVVSVNIAENATADQVAAAQKAAGEYVYSIFVQSNAGLLEESVAVIIPGGSTIDVSNHEWQAAKQWTGYFGTSDASNPITIKGLRLTSATSYALTYQLTGSSSRYNITGFIGAVYGDATIENIVFDDVTIDSPGNDYLVVEGQKSRNTVAIIGGIIPDPGHRANAVNVTIKNIEVKDNCTINGIASVGGIVGYIGAEQGSADLHGSVVIDNCSFAGSIVSTDTVYASKAGYSPAGGILGFTCRCNNTEANIVISNCTFSGSIIGQGSVGGIVGGQITGKISIENCSVAGATIQGNGAKGNVAKIEGYTQMDVNIDDATLSSLSDGDIYVTLYASLGSKPSITIKVNGVAHTFTKNGFEDLTK